MSSNINDTVDHADDEAAAPPSIGTVSETKELQSSSVGTDRQGEDQVNKTLSSRAPSPNQVTYIQQQQQKQENKPAVQRQGRGMYYLGALLLILLVAGVALALILGSGNNSNQGKEASVTAIYEDEVDDGGEVESIKEDLSCPDDKTNLFTVQYDWKGNESRANASSVPSSNSDDDKDDDGYTWLLRDGCSGKLIAKCQPCDGPNDDGDVVSLFQTNNNTSTSTEEKGDHTQPKRKSITKECVPLTRDYVLDVRPLVGQREKKNPCCGFSNPFEGSFFSLYDGDVVVAMLEDGIVSMGGGSILEEGETMSDTESKDGSSIGVSCDDYLNKRDCKKNELCSYSRSDGCYQTSSQSGDAIAAAVVPAERVPRWSIRFGGRTEPCVDETDAPAETPFLETLEPSSAEGPTSDYLEGSVLSTSTPVTPISRPFVPIGELPFPGWYEPVGSRNPSGSPTSGPLAGTTLSTATTSGSQLRGAIVTSTAQPPNSS